MPKKHIYIVEHLEPKLWAWCLIEYKHISKIIGKERLLFTNINRKDLRKLVKYGKVFTESVQELKLVNACILDPEAPEKFTPKKAASYKYLIFGGILGDYPPRKRTAKELSVFFPKLPKYNLGNMQMSTDNAIYVAKRIVEGVPFSKLRFRDCITARLNKIESVDFPYRYALVRKKPLISKELIKYLKSK